MHVFDYCSFFQLYILYTCPVYRPLAYCISQNLWSCRRNKKCHLSISESQSREIICTNYSEGLILQGKHHVNHKYFLSFLILLMLFQHGQPYSSTSDSTPPLPTSLCLSHPPTPLLCLAALVWPLPSLAGGRTRCPELANNNQGVALCDTPSLGLDNEQAPDSRFAGEWQPLEHGPMRAEDGGVWGEMREERKRWHKMSVRRIIDFKR